MVTSDTSQNRVTHHSGRTSTLSPSKASEKTLSVRIETQGHSDNGWGVSKECSDWKGFPTPHPFLLKVCFSLLENYEGSNGQ